MIVKKNDLVMKWSYALKYFRRNLPINQTIQIFHQPQAENLKKIRFEFLIIQKYNSLHFLIIISFFFIFVYRTTKNSVLFLFLRFNFPTESFGIDSVVRHFQFNCRIDRDRPLVRTHINQ